jgi:hypothetical protein
MQLKTNSGYLLVMYMVVIMVMMPSKVRASEAAPSINQIDAHIADSLSKINEISNSGKDDDGSKVIKANRQLLRYIKDDCKRADFLKAPLKKATDAGLGRHISSDSKLCIYCWDSMTGGTMHSYWSLAQFQDGNELRVQLFNPNSMSDEDFEGGYFYETISTVKTKDNKTVYLVTGNSRGSTIDFGEIIQAYSINKGKLVPEPIFQVKAKMLDQISFDVHDAELVAIQVSPDLQKVSVPIVTKDGTPTDKFLIYKFNGSKFVFDATAK